MHTTRAIDNAPAAMEDVREYFERLSDAQLRSCWLAVIVENSTREFAVGELARALLVVRKRLCPVDVAADEQATPVPQTQKPTKPICIVEKRPRRPEPERLKLHGDWVANVRQVARFRPTMADLKPPKRKAAVV